MLFGTGMRGGAAARSATARVGDKDADVLYIGAQGTFDGLDQVNVRLPRTLVGAGKVAIEISLDGGVANRVTVDIR
jgi:uncharacterized protein (TIGR03437 family)